MFQEARHEFRDHICHWGPVASHSEYLQKLSRADIFVSTAQHEFFGLSVMESIAIGLAPLLPDRLSYPELLDREEYPAAEDFLYDGSIVDLARHLNPTRPQSATVAVLRTAKVPDANGLPLRLAGKGCRHG